MTEQVLMGVVAMPYLASSQVLRIAHSMPCSRPFVAPLDGLLSADQGDRWSASSAVSPHASPR